MASTVAASASLPDQVGMFGGFQSNYVPLQQNGTCNHSEDLKHKLYVRIQRRP